VDPTDNNYWGHMVRYTDLHTMQLHLL